MYKFDSCIFRHIGVSPSGKARDFVGSSKGRAHEVQVEDGSVPSPTAMTPVLVGSNPATPAIYGELAHLEEHLPCTQKVIGSSPIFSNFAFYCLHVARNGYWLRLAKIEINVGVG